MPAEPVAPGIVAFAPGRVNLIGEHTDYNDGLALPFAIERGVTVRAQTAATAAAGDEVEVCSELAGEHDRFPRGAPAPVGGWRAFARGVVAELSAAGVEIPACSVRITSDLPAGAGLSSSAALSCALALALLALAGEPAPEPVALARLCSRVETDWVGAPTGLLDPLACLLGREGSVLAIDFRTLEVELVTVVLDGWELAVLDSGASRALAGSGYAARRGECADACVGLGTAALRDVSLSDLARLPEPLVSRARHVAEENDRVLDAVTALRAGDLPLVGRLLDASHASLRDLYDCSTPEVEATVARLHAAGAAGARMVGGGFGGSVLALFPPDTAPPTEALVVRPAAGAVLRGARLPAGTAQLPDISIPPLTAQTWPVM